jgi:hypothetical protein
MTLLKSAQAGKLRLLIGRALLYFVLPAARDMWLPDAEYLRRVAKFGDDMLASVAENPEKSAWRLP